MKESVFKFIASNLSQGQGIKIFFQYIIFMLLN